MPQPTVQDVHQDQVLSHLSIAYRNAEYIASEAVPKVLVNKASDKFYEFSQGDWFRDEAGLRAPMTTGPVGGYRLSTRTYQTRQYSMTTYVADEERDNADEGLDLDRQAIEYCTDKVLLRLEREVADLLFDGGQYAVGHTTTLTGADQWDDPTSDPIGQVRSAKLTVSGAIGRHPNTLILGEEVYTALQDHPQIVERIKYTQRGIVTPDLLASLLDVERVLVGRAIENTAEEGELPNYQRVWGKHAALLYVAPRPGLRTLSFAYWFVWRGVRFCRGALAEGRRGERRRVPGPRPVGRSNRGGHGRIPVPGRRELTVRSQTRPGLLVRALEEGNDGPNTNPTPWLFSSLRHAGELQLRAGPRGPAEQAGRGAAVPWRRWTQTLGITLGPVGRGRS
ncbi:MAG: hypothetical protein KatS3mg115_1376 [Candidatus Poribacteria bacterium]|nr:MAG: hypothetical protein KatS3mg115_1376 [Candidatus Poribacteria bacterium]